MARRFPSPVRSRVVRGAGRAARALLLPGGVLGVLALVYYAGAGSVASALSRITWWQFVLICAVHGVSVAADTLGWRYAVAANRPSFPRLLAAKCAGEAVNAITILGSLGGEPVKAWLLRRELSYEASVPSLILAKTTLVVAQTMLLVVGIAVAWTTGVGGSALLVPMGHLLLAQVIGVGGLVGIQIAGVIGRADRVLAWAGLGRPDGARQLDQALRTFYRHEWGALVMSTAMHFAGWLLGIAEAYLVLVSLQLPVSVATATVIEAIGAGVRFATFFVPASLGTLEGANAATAVAFGWAASAGLAFSLVRRARQVVWIALGAVILVVMSHPRAVRVEAVGPARPDTRRSRS
jgi:hypothetical protein